MVGALGYYKRVKAYVFSDLLPTKRQRSQHREGFLGVFLGKPRKGMIDIAICIYIYICIPAVPEGRFMEDRGALHPLLWMGRDKPPLCDSWYKCLRGFRLFRESDQ